MNCVFVDVDTQVDFLDPAGALYVPGSQEILPNIRRLLEWATQQRITTVSPVDAHVVDDVEFRQYGRHCVDGSPGQQRYFAALPALPRHVWEPAAELNDAELRLLPGQHYVAKKRTFPMFSNAGIARLRDRGVFRGLRCVVFGVATDVCVRADALDLCDAGASVHVVRDAIAGLTPDGTERALADMRAAGVAFTTTDAILAGR